MILNSRLRRPLLGSAVLCATIALLGPGTGAIGASTTVSATTHTGAQSGAQSGTGKPVELPTHVPYRPTGVDDPRPNVVFITTDDETDYDMRWMPKTRRWLGEGGTEFPNMISPHPLCCPARAEMMTGQFAQNNGVHTNAGPYGGLPALKDPDNTLPWWLQKEHYQTGMIGKYLNQYNVDTGVPRGWDYWNAATHNEFGYYGYQTYNDGNPKWYGRNLHGNTYSTDLIAQDTVNLVNQYSQDERPFFIWSSYYAPHGTCGARYADCANPPVPATKYAHEYPDVVAPSLSKPSFNEKDMSDKPPLLRRATEQHPITTADAQFLFSQRIRALKSVDDGVDATMKALQANGELNNTIVIFTSDNGYLIGEHRYKGKVMPYEEALQVPLYVRGPGIPAGVERPQTVTMVDMASTILDYTGVAPGRLQDGSSFRPFIESAIAVRANNTVLIQAGGKTQSEPWIYRGVRTGRYTYVEWVDGFVELYDRDNDRYETHNVAPYDGYAAVVKELHDRTLALKDCAGAACRAHFEDLHGILKRSHR